MQPKPKQPFESLPTYMTDSEVVRFVELVVGAPHASYWKSIMRYIGLDCGPARSPAGQPLTEEEYAAYAAKLDKLGFVKRNAAH